MTLCPDWSLRQDLVDTVTVVSLKCRCWRCENCGEERRNALIKRIKAGEPDLFLTFTIRGGTGATPLENRALLAWAVNQVIRRIKRRYKLKSFPYVVVVEAHKSGEPHVHMLARARYVDQAWLSKQWEELTGAFRVDVRRIQDRGRAGAYVAKYLAKKPHQFGTFKRYWFSRDYDTTWRKDAPEGEARGSCWRVERQSVRAFIESLPQHLWVCTLVRGGVKATRRC